MTIICPNCKHHFVHVTPRQRGTPKERFDRKVFVAPNGCWLWLGGHGKHGYPTFYADGKQVYAHRFSWMFHRGPIPAGLDVCHNCPSGDNPSCVNPDHLFLGTHTDNMQDMHRKGRWTMCGERARTAKLTAGQVLEIRRKRATGATEQSLANEHGILQPAISSIVLGKSWKHLLPERRMAQHPNGQ